MVAIVMALQHRSYKIITHRKDIKIIDGLGKSYLLNSHNDKVKMEDHEVAVEKWKVDQRLTKVETTEERERRKRDKK